MKRTALRLTAALVLVGALAGCATATVGTPFPANNVGLLRTGVSTTEDARSLLGQPWQVQTLANGEQVHIWQYIRSDATSGIVTMNVKTSTQQAALVFGPDNRLARVQNLINVPAPIAAVAQPAALTTAVPVNAAGMNREQQLQDLQNTQGLSYEEYKRRYQMIMGVE
ncbi:hypothetical protein [Pseudomonas spirodelae]|uniref:Lipoprotein SmpA/OmlA domain-containing protein n=1 Tax=Pseudomonas spirodelae TaxID=3101751 RepID=A0ABU5P7W4_9PSED|nr:hypothetical protein [Pseudomonas sp. T5W1]MEA1605756.1 hypothetical protein [Pseudomonas sp. T5W1]